MLDAPLGWCQNGWVKREMKRRYGEGRAERGLFSTGLAGQAARQAGSQAQSTIYAQMLPSLLLFYRPHISSARCSVLSKNHLWQKDSRSLDHPTLHSAINLYLLYFDVLDSFNLRRYTCCLLKTLRICLPSFPFGLLPVQHFTLHIPFAGRYIEQ